MRDYSVIVPKNLAENQIFRRRMWQEGDSSKVKARAIRKMCADSPIFFINTFCWTLSPTFFPDNPVQPFVLYPKQEEITRKLVPTIGKQDASFLKSRGIGATWWLEYLLLHRWLFMSHQKFIMASQNESLVDKTGDTDALMPKLDYALQRMPPWLKPAKKDVLRQDLTLINESNGCSFIGVARTKDLARSRRATVLFCDEAAFFETSQGKAVMGASQEASYGRWFISTPNGMGNVFYDVVNKTKITNYRIHWSDMPFKNKGMYTWKPGDRIKLVDPTYNYPPGYEFRQDGRLRSPWYDREWDRCPIASQMAQEHDCEFIGSGDPFFNAMEVEKIAHEMSETPKQRWAFDSTDRLIQSDSGPIKLWINLDVDRRPPRDRSYGAGCDISLGVASSDSVMCVFDWRTRKKVMEYAVNDVEPAKFSRRCAILGRWFSDYEKRPAKIIWEANGPGRTFGKGLTDGGYSNLYYSKPKEDPLASRSDSEVPGLWMAGRRKSDLLNDWFLAIACGDTIDPSEKSIKELHKFQHAPGGRIIHASDATGTPSSQGENHGDRVIASALGYHIMPRSDELREDLEQDFTFTEIGQMIERNLDDQRLRRQYDEGWLVEPSYA